MSPRQGSSIHITVYGNRKSSWYTFFALSDVDSGNISPVLTGISHTDGFLRIRDQTDYQIKPGGGICRDRNITFSLRSAAVKIFQQKTVLTGY